MRHGFQPDQALSNVSQCTFDSAQATERRKPYGRQGPGMICRRVSSLCASVLIVEPDEGARIAARVKAKPTDTVFFRRSRMRFFATSCGGDSCCVFLAPCERSAKGDIWRAPQEVAKNRECAVPCLCWGTEPRITGSPPFPVKAILAAASERHASAARSEVCGLLHRTRYVACSTGNGGEPHCWWLLPAMPSLLQPSFTLTRLSNRLPHKRSSGADHPVNMLEGEHCPLFCLDLHAKLCCALAHLGVSYGLFNGRGQGAGGQRTARER